MKTVKISPSKMIHYNTVIIIVVAPDPCNIYELASAATTDRAWLYQTDKEHTSVWRREGVIVSACEGHVSVRDTLV